MMNARLYLLFPRYLFPYLLSPGISSCQGLYIAWNTSGFEWPQPSIPQLPADTTQREDCNIDAGC